MVLGSVVLSGISSYGSEVGWQNFHGKIPAQTPPPPPPLPIIFHPRTFLVQPLIRNLALTNSVLVRAYFSGMCININIMNRRHGYC